MHHLRNLLAAVILGPALLAAQAASAGSATLDVGNGNQVTFEYNDSMLRINNAIAPGSYAVLRDGTLYTVAETGGMPMVMDAGAMMKSMGRMPGMDGFPAPAGVGDLDGRIVELRDTGSDETVAGIPGDVYELTLEESNGEQRRESLVLSSDTRVLEFRDAMLLMMDIAAGIAPEQGLQQGLEQGLQHALEQGGELEKRLRSMNAGVLRFGDQMSIIAISGDAMPAARFELPARPMDLQGIGSILGDMQKRLQQR